MWQQMTSSLAERALLEPTAGSENNQPDILYTATPVLIEDERLPAVLTVTPVESARQEIILRLSASGYVTWAAGTVCEALELAEQVAPDVIVLDLDEQYEAGPQQGVVISGFRLLHLLRRLTSGRPVALVVVTRLDYAEVEGAIRASADALVNKPVLLAQLLGRLRAALERVRRRYQQSVPLPHPWPVGRMN